MNLVRKTHFCNFSHVLGGWLGGVVVRASDM